MHARRPTAPSIDMATEVGAMWAVMPCCMRTAACFPEGCEMLRCPDATRHALLCWEASAHVSHMSHVSGGVRRASQPHVSHVSHVSGGVRRAGRPR